jgi:hypothetical protein
MARLTSDGVEYDYQWASDVSFDGIRLEVLAAGGHVLFDVSVADGGSTSVNTFSNEIPAPLIAEAVRLAGLRG